MSTLILDSKKVIQIADRLKTNRTKLLITSDIYLIEKIMQEIHNLNVLSYNIRYPNDEEITPDNIYFNTKNIKSIDIYQALKYLQCLRYNIDFTLDNKSNEIKLSSKQLETIEILDLWITLIIKHILDQIPEYINSKWA